MKSFVYNQGMSVDVCDRDSDKALDRRCTRLEAELSGLRADSLREWEIDSKIRDARYDLEGAIRDARYDHQDKIWKVDRRIAKIWSTLLLVAYVILIAGLVAVSVITGNQ